MKLFFVFKSKEHLFFDSEPGIKGCADESNNRLQIQPMFYSSEFLSLNENSLRSSYLQK